MRCAFGGEPAGLLLEAATEARHSLFGVVGCRPPEGRHHQVLVHFLAARAIREQHRASTVEIVAALGLHRQAADPDPPRVEV